MPNARIETRTLTIETRNKSNDGKGMGRQETQRKHRMTINNKGGKHETAGARCKPVQQCASLSASLIWMAIRLGLRVCTVVKVLQLEVDAASLVLIPDRVQ